MKKLRKGIIPLLFLLPALVLLGSLALYPVVESVRMSFMEWDGFKELRFVGIKNYIKIFKSKDFFNPKGILNLSSPPYGALIHSLIWLAIFLPLITILGLTFSVLLRNVKGKSVIKSFIFIGMVVPMIVCGVVIRFMYDETAGIINAFFRLIGLGNFAKTWTAYPDTALLALILGSVWVWTGFSMIIYAAGLDLVSEELYDAAEIDGASPWKIFWRITVPILKPCTVFIIIMGLIAALRIFDMVYVTTYGGPGSASMVLGLLIYIKTFVSIPSDLGSATAISTFLLFIALVTSIFLIRQVKE